MFTSPTAAEVQRHLDALRQCTLCRAMQPPVVVGRPIGSRIILVGQAPGDGQVQFEKLGQQVFPGGEAPTQVRLVGQILKGLPHSAQRWTARGTMGRSYAGKTSENGTQL